MACTLGGEDKGDELGLGLGPDNTVTREGVIKRKCANLN